MHYTAPIYVLFQPEYGSESLFCMILLMKTMCPAVMRTIAALLSPMLKLMSSVMLLVLMEREKCNSCTKKSSSCVIFLRQMRVIFWRKPCKL